MTFRATPKQILKAIAWGILLGAASYGAYRLLGGAPDRAEGLWRILWILLLGPILEETVFRGLAFRPAEQYLGAKWAILLCAALFALAHWGFPNLPLAFLAGLLFGWIRHKSGNLLCPILAHMSANAALLLLQTVI